MERSKLENIGNTQLYFVLKRIVNEFGDDYDFDENDIDRSDFKDECETACKIVGMSEPDYIDYNYILSTLMLNDGFDYSQNKVTGTLNRPEVGLFSFDYDEIRVETVRTTYTHEISSYGRNLVFPTVESMQSDGVFDYYEGSESDRDFIDGETTDANLDYKSLKQIK